MGKSKRKTPILGITTSLGHKSFKESEHRAERSKVHTLLRNAVRIIDNIETFIQNEILLPHPKEYGNEWASPRDGKSWHGHLENHPDFKKWMRK